MLKFIDNLLNRVTMYRFILYYLLGLWVAALALAAWGKLPFEPTSLLLSTVVIIAVCWFTNLLFALVFEAPTNVESVYITAFILVFLITPPQASQYQAFLSLAAWAAVWAMASKYIIAVRHKHVFNPAAFAVALTALTINQSASWWVGDVAMVWFVLAGGLLMVRKLRRADLVISFLVMALAAIFSSTLGRSGDLVATAKAALLHSPILFFAFVMLTEPLTTPPTRTLRLAYGVLVGLLFNPSLHFGSIYSTPELALVAGNLFAFAVSPKGRLLLTLKEKVQTAPDAADFLFQPNRPVSFRPGQYLEWTLVHDRADSRGNRRYFTIASSPTEREVRMGVKFYPRASSFKKSLWHLRPGDTIVASQLAGDFVLPRDPRQPLVLIAGGIGITPFRSMVKYLLDRNEKRPIVLLYSNKTAPEIIYQDVFHEAQAKLGLKTVYTLTDVAHIPPDWPGHWGKIDWKLIAQEVPDYNARLFYVSGPHAMVTGFTETLKMMGVPRRQIRTDFFPGFA